MRQNSISKFKSLLASMALAICSTSLMATDTYDPATNQLSIPSVQVGTATYNNVVITVGSIVSIGGASSTQSAEGLWSGLTSTGYEVNSLILENNEFWKAQISQIIVAKDGGIVLIPTIGTTRIDFGLATNIENKFKKLFIFYQKVIPNKGWNKYSWVQLKYKNQVICE